jgi:hypothetical protein
LYPILLFHSLLYLFLFLFEELPWYPTDRVLC